MLHWCRRNLLVVIILVAFMAVSAMSMEQARVIETQRDLIRLLYVDNMELNARRMHDVQVKRGK